MIFIERLGYAEDQLNKKRLINAIELKPVECSNPIEPKKTVQSK